ncbi:MAG: DUF4962 domain-containing protein [Planctomycetes bacterium]|nr:DUF4962 domain-containing protein [Planctomycetota bacterium]
MVRNLLLRVTASVVLASVALAAATQPALAQSRRSGNGKSGAAKGHPRLLFTQDDIEAMKQRTRSGNPFYSDLTRYLGAASQPPTNQAFLTDATDAQRQFFWKLPTVALHYVLTGDKKSLEQTAAFMKILLELEHWETGTELDSGMGAANVMVGAALAYDWTFNDLPQDFRKKFRDKLILQATRMYEGGHLMKNPGTHYWQNDPQNNHRYHRDAGLVLSVLAAHEGTSDTDKLMKAMADELKFVHKWLPEDGTCHESPSYMAFGFQYLVMAFDAADRCLGTDFLSHPFFKNAPMFRIQSMTPDLVHAFRYGDTDGSPHFYNHCMLRLCAKHKLADVQAAGMEAYKRKSSFFEYGWYGCIWYDPTLTGGSLDKVPTTAFYPDLGITYARDGWKKDDVGMMFKCGPYGGYTLNAFCNGGSGYANVAHDDPDANMFEIYTHGETVAIDDGYSEKKLTSGHNTILVNGRGQKGEGDEWTQPYGGMDRAARVVSFKDAGPVVIAEGEAGGAYSDLVRYRRIVAWVKSRYILILDDIAARNKDTEITWLVQGKDLAEGDGKNRYVLSSGGAHCGFKVAADQPFDARIGASSAQHKGQSMGLKQLQLRAKTKRWRVITLFDPWNHERIDMKVDTEGSDQAEIRVKGPAFDDLWQWKCAPGDRGTTPSQSGLRGTFEDDHKVELTSKDRAPQPRL